MKKQQQHSTSKGDEENGKESDLTTKLVSGAVNVNSNNINLNPLGYLF